MQVNNDLNYYFFIEKEQNHLIEFEEITDINYFFNILGNVKLNEC